MHCQYNLLMPGRCWSSRAAGTTTLRKGDCLPLTILNMLVLTTLTVAQAGGTCIVMDRLDAEGVAEWIRDERVTVWNGPPALLHSLATQRRGRARPISRRSTRCGPAAPTAPRRSGPPFEEKFGLPVLATYGLTEAPTVVAIDPPGGPHVDAAQRPRRCRT